MCKHILDWVKLCYTPNHTFLGHLEIPKMFGVRVVFIFCPLVELNNLIILWFLLDEPSADINNFPLCQRLCSPNISSSFQTMAWPDNCTCRVKADNIYCPHKQCFCTHRQNTYCKHTHCIHIHCQHTHCLTIQCRHKHCLHTNYIHLKILVFKMLSVSFFICYHIGLWAKNNTLL